MTSDKEMPAPAETKELSPADALKFQGEASTTKNIANLFSNVAKKVADAIKSIAYGIKGPTPPAA